MTDAANVIAVDHTGFAVSSLDEAIRFWTGALGFTLERQSEMGGDFLHQVTGVDDPKVKTAIVKAQDGYVVELLEYSNGLQNGTVRRGIDRSGPPGSDRKGYSCRHCPRRGNRMEGERQSAADPGWSTEGNVGGLRFRPRSYHDRAYAADSLLMGQQKLCRFIILLEAGEAAGRAEAQHLLCYNTEWMA
jgi:catechol 2,3-dioxygenase-like lactoylglutathione lyase family enzyme